MLRSGPDAISLRLDGKGRQTTRGHLGCFSLQRADARILSAPPSTSQDVSADTSRDRQLSGSRKATTLDGSRLATWSVKRQASPSSTSTTSSPAAGSAASSAGSGGRSGCTSGAPSSLTTGAWRLLGVSRDADGSSAVIGFSCSTTRRCLTNGAGKRGCCQTKRPCLLRPSSSPPLRSSDISRTPDGLAADGTKVAMQFRYGSRPRPVRFLLASLRRGRGSRLVVCRGDLLEGSE